MAQSEKNLNAVFTDAANAIRAKKGSSTKIKPINMADEIASIPTGTTPTGTFPIDTNGTHNITEYAYVDVNVPNPSSGTLPISQNGDYNVTNYANVSVNVSGGGGSGTAYVYTIPASRTLDVSGKANARFDYLWSYKVPDGDYENSWLQDSVLTPVDIAIKSIDPNKAPLYKIIPNSSDYAETVSFVSVKTDEYGQSFELATNTPPWHAYTDYTGVHHLGVTLGLVVSSVHALRTKIGTESFLVTVYINSEYYDEEQIKTNFINWLTEDGQDMQFKTVNGQTINIESGISLEDIFTYQFIVEQQSSNSSENSDYEY